MACAASAFDEAALKPTIGAAVRAVADALSSLPAPSMIIGGIRRIVGEFAAALDESERVDDLEQIIRRVAS